jgi:hypothetical protein
MKKLLRILSAFLAVTFILCNGTISATGSKKSNEEKIAQQEIVKKSVESGRFIIKLDRIYLRRGGIADLRPRANYIILDKGNALISTAYIGRQYEVLPILALKMAGKATISDIERHSKNGKYLIKMKVENGSETLNLTLRISSNGSCDASISGLMIDNTSYSGKLVPVKENIEPTPPPGISI